MDRFGTPLRVGQVVIIRNNEPSCIEMGIITHLSDLGNVSVEMTGISKNSSFRQPERRLIVVDDALMSRAMLEKLKS
jgi:hypothetical protein